MYKPRGSRGLLRVKTGMLSTPASLLVGLMNMSRSGRGT